MSFAIYGSDTGSNLLWGPVTKTVTVENGIYHAILGETTPITTFNPMAAIIWRSVLKARP